VKANLMIEQAKSILESHDILDGRDYIISLQGPTVILTIEGKTKITPQIIDELIPTGIGVML